MLFGLAPDASDGQSNRVGDVEGTTVTVAGKNGEAVEGMVKGWKKLNADWVGWV